MSPSEPLIIAVDGPSASGKSTVSRGVARRLGLVYVDSGSLYRGLTWLALREGIAADDTAGLGNLLEQADFRFNVEHGRVGFTIGGAAPGDDLRSRPVAEAVSDYAAVPAVRRFVVARLRDMARFGGLVMEGRDIGSVVFPATPFKFYLDADPRERARRRLHDRAGPEGGDDMDAVLGALQRRDSKDAGREAAPLQIASGARIVNSTAMSAEEVIDLIIADVQSRSAPA